MHFGDAVVGHQIAKFFPGNGWFGAKTLRYVKDDDRYEVRARTAVAVIRLRVVQGLLLGLRRESLFMLA